MSTDKTFGMKVKDLRTGRGLTQGGLALRAELSQPEISKIEKGNVKHIKAETIQRLAEAFEIRPEILVHGTTFAPMFGESLIFPDGATNESPPIVAYFASALTGLPAEHEAEIIALDERVDEIFRNYPYPLALYRPRKKTSPKDNPEIPAAEVYEIDQERVASADVVILAALFPSLGAGMELQLALQSCTSVILLTKRGQTISRMVVGCPADMERIEYGDLDELEEKLKDKLREMTRSFAAFRFPRRRPRGSEEFEFGTRLKKLRNDLGLQPEDVGRMIGVHESYIQALESKSERISNPSLHVIRELAKALMTSEIYLVSGQHGLSSVFHEHFETLKAFATDVQMPYADMNELWNNHHEKFKYDLSVPGVSNRATIGDRAYWLECYEKLKESQKDRGKLFS